MKLWGGRFREQNNDLVFRFNESLSFDRRLFHEDITGSMAHVKMLARQGILTEAERDAILDGLTGILADLENGSLPFDESCEDIHSFV